MRTFGDTTKTPGQYVGDRCYILAQFPESSNFDWARDLRMALGGGELKYQKYLTLRHVVQSNRHLWARVRQGTSEATVVVIENSFYIQAIAFRLKEEGAELGHDVTFEDMLKQAALCMIAHAPVMRIPEIIPDVLTGAVAAKRFTPEMVYERVGNKLNDAAMFAARAHAAFDIDALADTVSTNELFTAPHRGRLFFEVNHMERIFDKDHPKSAVMLNELFSCYDTAATLTPRQWITEAASDSQDELQAADFCAGFASEIMMNASDDPQRELRQHFRRVIFNGATR